METNAAYVELASSTAEMEQEVPQILRVIEYLEEAKKQQVAMPHSASGTAPTGGHYCSKCLARIGVGWVQWSSTTRCASCGNAFCSNCTPPIRSSPGAPPIRRCDPCEILYFESTWKAEKQRAICIEEARKLCNAILLRRERVKREKEQRIVELGFDLVDVKAALSVFRYDEEAAILSLEERQKQKAIVERMLHQSSQTPTAARPILARVQSDLAVTYFVERSVTDYAPLEPVAHIQNRQLYSTSFGNQACVLEAIPFDDSHLVLLLNRLLNLEKIHENTPYRGIVSVECAFVESSVLYIQYPRLQYSTLAEWRGTRKLEDWQIHSMAREVLQSVAVLHSHSLVLGRLTEDDVLVTADGQTMLHNIIGSLLQPADRSVPIAPEMAENPTSSPTEATDIWYFGLFLFRLKSTHETPYPVLLPGRESADINGDDHVSCLLKDLLRACPDYRLTANNALIHPYFGASLLSNYRENRQIIATDDKLNALYELIRFMRRTDSIMCLNVRRSLIVESVVSQFMMLNQQHLVKKLSVRFEGEAGVDAGGLTVEMFNLFFEQLLSETCTEHCDNDHHCKLFQRDSTAENPSYLPHAGTLSSEPEKLRFYEGIGKVLIKSLFDGYPVPVPFAPSVFKFLLNQKPNFADYQAFNPQAAQSCSRLLEHNDVTDWSLDFTSAGGDTTPVTNENKREYVQRMVEYVLIDQRKEALNALKRGFESIQLSAHLRLLSCTELMSIVQGQQRLDADMIKAKLKFSGFSSASRTPDYVRQFIETLSANDMRRFLRFITSQAALVTGDIKICAVPHISMFPKSHTCFNRLDLPDYNDKQTVFQRLRFCLDNLEVAGFGEA
eukprot:GILJ01011027.1.p1 GENE.GILJ01011027.1~~GILJ01011027.1.p1  ORF type:complete len:926 (-),score=132.33 GILJ01011027.1:79-2601(-)